jgi:hypothetical protein
VDIHIPLELRAQIPQLGEASGEADPMVWVKLTCEEAGWTWYIIEMQPLAQDAIFYVYTVRFRRVSEETASFRSGSLLQHLGQPRRSFGTTKRRLSFCVGIGAAIGEN